MSPSASASPPLLLASASPRRRDLLGQIGITPARIEALTVDETPFKHELPRDYAKRIAAAKADAAIARHPDHIVLAADTVVHMGRRILPKAETEAQARQCLEELSGRRHRVLTGVALYHPDRGKRERLVETAVQFKRLSAAETARYLESREWEGKAGGYGIQGLAGAYVTGINGSYSNVVGLPLAETWNLLQWAGVL